MLVVDLQNSVRTSNAQLTDLQEKQNSLNANFSEELFDDHLELIEKKQAEFKLAVMEKDLEELKATKEGTFLFNVDAIYDLYTSYKSKVTRNGGAKLDTKQSVDNVEGWGALLIDQRFDELTALITSENKNLDASYQKYLASLPPPATASGGGYSYITVNTEKGNFGMYLIKMPKSSVKVKTIAAIEDDCKDNCATKSMAQYVSENNAIAGVVGAYACPPDYPQCAGKVNSFDFAFYDSNDKEWFNEDALSWFETAMMTFNGNSTKFYEDTSDYDGDGVTGAVSNFPALLEDGNVVVDSGDIDSYQSVKGLRGAIGTDDKNIYLAYISNASVIDAAYAMRAAGAKDSLNLDGGGTAAMYVNGKYVVGPGRSVSNAILLVK